ncbi:MAG: Ig-like domain-containing protein [Terracidiphilus sp.]
MTSPGYIRLLLALALAFPTIAGNAQHPQSAGQPAGGTAADPSKAAVQYGKLPLSFEPNLGQTAEEVQWLARGPEYTLFLAGHDAVLELNAVTPSKPGTRPHISESAVRMNLLGARTVNRAAGEDPQPGKANYFTGRDPRKWQRNVPMYGKVRLQGVYPGVDLVYYGRQGQLEYDFVVAPGADASAIRWGFDGAKPELAANGDLLLPVINAEGGASDQIRLNRPVVYQMKDGVLQSVNGSFEVARNGQTGFKLGAYDKSRELIIDPTLMFMGAIGTGNQQSVPNGMALDTFINSKTNQPNNQIILTGITNDLNFPTTTGAYETSCQVPNGNGKAGRCGASSGSSAFVTKISADGTSLVYSTYLHGGNGYEAGQAVAVDSQDNAVILGSTGSDDFPVTSNAYQSICMPYYVGGQTPIVENCDGNFAGGGTEWVIGGPTLFIAKLSPDGSTIMYATYFGGTAQVYPVGLALDSSDNMYFSGWVQAAWPTASIYPNNSNQAIQFPVTSGAYQEVGLNGSQAGSLSVLSADGTTLLYSTFIASLNSASDPTWADPLAIAVGQNGIAAIGGVTLASTFPTTSGSVRPSCVPNPNNTGVCWDYTGWVSVFDTTQSGDASLIYSSYIGGDEVQGANEAENQVQGLAFDSSNNLYVTGFTTLNTYATTPGVFQAKCANQGNCNAAFLSKINLNESGYVWSTYFGGTNSSQTAGNAITFDNHGWVYLYGYNNGYGWDLPVVNPIVPLNGSNFAFVAAFSSDAKQLLFSTPVFESPTGSYGANAIADNGFSLDSNGSIYLAGYGNDGGALPATKGTYTTTATSGFNRGFFAKLSKVLEPVTTKLTISPLNALPGSSVTFTASVAGTAGNTPLPTGKVTVANGNTTPPTVLGTVTLGSNASGSFNTSSLRRGDYSVTATYSGDGNYETGASAAQTLAVNQFAPVVKVVPASLSIDRIDALSVTITVNATSGDPTPGGSVALSSGSYESAAATLSRGAAKIDVPANVLNDGTDPLKATYTPNASSSATYRTSTGSAVVNVAKVKQTIEFRAPASPVVYGVKPIKLTATASSHLPVTFSVLSGRAKISGDELAITGAGTVEVAANQRGNMSYKAAVDVTHKIVVDKAKQTIDFKAPPSKVTYPANPITLSAKASSHLAVTFSVVSGPAKVHGDTLTITGTGTVVVAAIQAGNANYEPAHEVRYSIVVQ